MYSDGNGSRSSVQCRHMTHNNISAKSSAKDVFLYLLMVIMLGVGVSYFTTLLWQYINVQFPDPLDFYYNGSLDLMRSAIATLVIVWPCLIVSSWMINKDLAIEAEKQNIWIRKWLLYLTLFVSAITVIVDLVTLTNSFLGGELNTRFLLKVLVILLVAVSVFAYYLWELRRDVKAKSNIHKIVAVSSSVVILLCIIGGFMLVGSPSEQRAVRFDQTRINDLSSIQNEVISYWILKGALPESVANITTSINGYMAPVDPDSGAEYKYTVTGDLSFELCADFATSDDVSDSPDARSPKRAITEPMYYSVSSGMNSVAWDHGIGEECFDRTIDPDLYKDQMNAPKPVF